MVPKLPDPDTLIRAAAKVAVEDLPALATLPRHVDRRTGAELVTRFYFPLSHRTLEAAPLIWRRVNGRAVCETVELCAWAQAKLDAAPPIRGGRASKRASG